MNRDEARERDYEAKVTPEVVTSPTWRTAYMAGWDDGYQSSEDVASALRDALARLPNDVPDTWLDPLLTGPDAVVRYDRDLWNGREIEALLRGIQDRLREKVDQALSNAERLLNGGMEKIRKVTERGDAITGDEFERERR